MQLINGDVCRARLLHRTNLQQQVGEGVVVQQALGFKAT